MISSPFLLSATIAHHLQTTNGPCNEQILRDLYVDNLITAVNTPDEAQQFYNHATTIFAKAKMNLRTWNSNCHEFKALISCQRRDERDVLKVLGLPWHATRDTLAIPVPLLDSSNVQTKREVLRAISAIYDPLGLVSPVVLPGKLATSRSA